MPNLFEILAVPSGNGTGASTSAAGMGSRKTVKVEGVVDGILSIEASLDAGATWATAAQFTGPGSRDLTLAADEIRISRSLVSAFPGAAPVVTVGANDSGALFAAIPVPAAPGVGAAVDVSALGSLNTVSVVGDVGQQFGIVSIEVSDDNISWNQVGKFLFESDGIQSASFAAQFVRARRTGGIAAGATVANIGAGNDVRPETSVIYPMIRLKDPGDPTRPTIVTSGVTFGFVFAVGDEFWFEFPLGPDLDRTQNIIIGVSWAPTGNEVGKLVSWQINAAAMKLGASVAVAGSVHQVIDAAVPATIAEYVRSGIVIPPSVWADPDTDEIHARLSRIASSNDPVADPGIHHIAVIRQMSA